jgi:predicted nucleic acid-binding protein
VGAGKLNAVLDAGPLIHLSEIGCLRLLNHFDALHVPDAVWAETVERGRVAEADFAILKNIQRHRLNGFQVKDFIEKMNLQGLHAGDRECLFVCENHHLKVLLTDDMAVRKATKRLNVVPLGSLGVVVAAFKAKEISLEEAEGYIADLYDVSSLFVTRTIAELAIEQLRKIEIPNKKLV